MAATYIEAIGHSSSVSQGMSMIRKLGRFVEFSVFGTPTTLDWSIIGDGKELDVLGLHLSPYCFPFVIEHISDETLMADGMIKTVFQLEEWEKNLSMQPANMVILRLPLHSEKGRCL